MTKEIAHFLIANLICWNLPGLMFTNLIPGPRTFTQQPPIQYRLCNVCFVHGLIYLYCLVTLAILPKYLWHTSLNPLIILNITFPPKSWAGKPCFWLHKTWWTKTTSSIDSFQCKIWLRASLWWRELKLRRWMIHNFLTRSAHCRRFSWVRFHRVLVLCSMICWNPVWYLTYGFFFSLISTASLH